VGGVAGAFWPLAHDRHPPERWSKGGVLDRLFEQRQRENILHLKMEAVSLDSTWVKAHPDGTGARKKNGPQSRGGWTPKCMWLPRMLERL